MSPSPIKLRSTLTCPRCGHRSTETMPTDACQYFYDCQGCGAVLKPKPGDCCVIARMEMCPVRRSRRAMASLAARRKHALAFNPTTPERTFPNP